MGLPWGFIYGAAGVILVDLVLAGDNALLIGLAVQKLPARLRFKASVLGALGAIILRLFFVFFAVQLLTLPYLRAAGGFLIILIAVKLLKPEKKRKNFRHAGKVWEAVKIILSADVVMSVDNVLGLAGIARDNFPLLVFGVALSVPLIVFGSSLVARCIDSLPILVLFGGLFLGWIGGVMVTEDVALHPYFLSFLMKYGFAASAAGAILAWWLWKRKTQKRP